MVNILVIIPARGGSKGIPRKNIRNLAGKTLIAYSIRTALNSNYKPVVYVSSDDDEILAISQKFGAKTHKRITHLSKDITTLDPVIYNAFKEIEIEEKTNFDIVVTLQPTSPLLRTSTLDSAIKKMIEDESIETVLSVVNDTHLTWGIKSSKPCPNYKARINRQHLPIVYKETGGFFVTRSSIITPESRIGNNVELIELSGGEEIDIDNFEDWMICDYLLRRKTLLFVLTGNNIIGLGHVYNSLIIANDILNHRILFLVDNTSQLAYEKIKEQNYSVRIQQSENLCEDIIQIKPDIVVNDILDTSLDYVNCLKEQGIAVINFEDLGPGAKKADLVINAIYPEKEAYPNHYFGADYFLLRDEFIYTPNKKIVRRVENILVTFGGVDPNNLTQKVVAAIYKYCVENAIAINVITGLGYQDEATLEKFPAINCIKNVKNISDYMSEADIVFSSAGRTVYEIASIGTPAIILAQNERELTHFYAYEKYGFINLGLGKVIEDNLILQKFKMLYNDFERRKKLGKKMQKKILKNGRKKVSNLINNIINENHRNF